LRRGRAGRRKNSNWCDNGLAIDEIFGDHMTDCRR
jgi:hypothetical protein